MASDDEINKRCFDLCETIRLGTFAEAGPALKELRLIGAKIEGDEAKGGDISVTWPDGSQRRHIAMATPPAAIEPAVDAAPPAPRKVRR